MVASAEKNNTFSKFLAPPYKAIMGHIFEERGKHVDYLFYIYLLMKIYRISLKGICFVNETNRLIAELLARAERARAEHHNKDKLPIREILVMTSASVRPYGLSG